MIVYNEKFNSDIEIAKEIMQKVRDMRDTESHEILLNNASMGNEKSRLIIEGYIKSELKKANINDIDSKFVWAYGQGLMQLQEFVDDPSVDEVMLRGRRILVQRKAVTHLEGLTRSLDESLSIVRTAIGNSRDINQRNPIVETKNELGHRISAIYPGTGYDTYLNIRLFNSFEATIENMIESGTLSEEMVEFYKIIVKGRANIITIGQMGSGKTTFLSFLFRLLPEGSNVGTIETKFEFGDLNEKIPHVNWTSLQIDDALEGEIEIEDLFKSMLKLNVDRIMMGEARGVEASTMLDAMSRGHSGSMATTHSLTLLLLYHDLFSMTKSDSKFEVFSQRLANTIDIVPKFEKIEVDGEMKRINTEVIENTYINNKIIPNVIFRFNIEKKCFEKVGKISKRLREKLGAYNIKDQEMDRWC